MARRKARWRRAGRIKTDDEVWEILYGLTRRRSFPDARERWCYCPGEANRVIAGAGGWVFVIRSVPVEDAPKPGCGYWAVPWQAAREGYDDHGRYSVSITLPNGDWARLWPYEYGLLSQEEIDRGLACGELIFHPMAGGLNLSSLPVVGDIIGSMMLDGLSVHEAVYELTVAGLRGVRKIKAPAPGWFEATFGWTGF